MNEVISLLDAHHKVPLERKDYPEKRIYPELPTEGNKVYFAHYDMVQVEMLMKSNVGEYNPEKEAISKLFNEYFGSGLSSIVFQEIRESKALAYSAYAYYSSPNDLKNNHYVNAYVGSQSNKFPDAVDAMVELMNNMPEVEDQFEQSKQSALKKIESTRTKRSSFYWRKLFAAKMNYDEDREEHIYNELKELKFNDMKKFYEENIKGLNYTFLIIGDRKLISMETLESLGTVQELTLEEIFGY
jgi:predicted Zn-dependent peptidase